MLAAPDDADPLSPALLDSLARRGGNRSFPARAVLINEGDETDSLYIVLAGRVKVYSTSDDGRRIVLAELGPGQYVGELALDGARRSASVEAVEPTRCCIVPGSEIEPFLAEHPDFAAHLLRKLIRMARRLTEQVKSLALQDVYGRVARLLTEASDVHGDVSIVRHRLTQQDIAERVGASREMVNRVMKELTIGGYVSLDDSHRYVIRRRLPAAW